MFRSLLALAVRSLREDTRTLQPHVFRLMFAAFILVTLIFAHLQTNTIGAPGLRFFTGVCWLNFIFISLGAVSVFATPITEEKEEATLGLLRMAGIPPFGLLIGKSSTRLFIAILILAIQYPFTLLSITLGGVLWHQISAGYLSLLAYLVFAAQMGLFCSVICSRSSSAAGLSGVLIGAALIGPAVAGYALAHVLVTYPGMTFLLEPLRDACLWLKGSAIWVSLNETIQTGFAGEVFSQQVWTNLLVGAVLFLLSGLTFDFFTRDHLMSVPARGSLLRWKSGSQGLRRWISPGRAWNLAVTWKEFHFITGGFSMLVGRFVTYFALIAGSTMFRIALNTQEPIARVFSQTACVTMICLGGLEFAIYCARIFREELRWQTYSALVMLPGTLGGMAWSKVFACLLAWFPGLFWLALGIALDLKGVGDALHSTHEHPTLPVFIFLHYVVFLHLVAWTSLLSKWGALPLSFVIAYPLGWTLIGGTITVFRISPRADGNLFFLVLDVLALCAIPVLQALIWQQLNVHAERA
jgi:hypothetical protein